LLNDIATTPESTYYMFLGAHMPLDVVPNLSDDTNDTMISAYHNMICGKKVQPTDAAMMIRNVQWTSNTVYTQYDDLDTDIATDDFYAIVNAGAYSHIWKCLDNNMGANSTVVPDIAQISSEDTYYRTGDGYVWKYMASTPELSIVKFGTDVYFPVFANSQVTEAAVAGAVDMVAIDDVGLGYRNYLTGTFAAADIRVNGNTVTYAVTGNSVSSVVNGFYSGCNLYIAGGSGIGQYKTILDYVSNANGNFCIIDSQFSTPPQNGSTYQIYPTVTIRGQGVQSINAAARAIINSVGNTVSRVDILERGAGYTFLSANVVADVVAQPTAAAVVRPIYAPFQGHGFNVYEELAATRVSFSVTFANNEANTIPATNQFQQVGILKNPQFSNVNINFSEKVGTFLSNEQVYTYSGVLLQNACSVAAGSANVTAPDYLTSQVGSGDPIVLAADDGTAFWYTTVNVVSNATFLTIDTVPQWACTSTLMYLATLGTGEGLVTSLPGGNTIGISNCTGTFSTGEFVIGVSSGALGITNNVSRNDVLKGFNTFVAARKLVATSVSGTFQPNEIIYMGSNVQTSDTTAAVHSVANVGGTLTFLVSNNVGNFLDDVTLQIKGANSGAVATITTKYDSEIVFGSSKVLYLENIAPITRSNTTSDTVNLILEF
jgi:hypothetical protein